MLTGRKGWHVLGFAPPVRFDAWRRKFICVVDVSARQVIAAGYVAEVILLHSEMLSAAENIKKDWRQV